MSGSNLESLWDKLDWVKTEEVEPPTHARLAVRSGASSAVREVRSLRSVDGVWFRVWWNPFTDQPEHGMSQWMQWARMPERPEPSGQMVRRKFQVKVGSGTSKTVWIKTSVTERIKEGATVDFKIVGDPKWRRGVAYDVTWDKASPFKLTMGGPAPS